MSALHVGWAIGILAFVLISILDYRWRKTLKQLGALNKTHKDLRPEEMYRVVKAGENGEVDMWSQGPDSHPHAFVPLSSLRVATVRAEKVEALVNDMYRAMVLRDTCVVCDACLVVESLRTHCSDSCSLREVIDIEEQQEKAVEEWEALLVRAEELVT